MYIYRYEVVGRQVEGLSDRDGHLIFSHLLFGREVKDSSDGRVLKRDRQVLRHAEDRQTDR